MVRSVESCPTAFDIASPDIVTDYGYDPTSEVTQKLGDKTQVQHPPTPSRLHLAPACRPLSPLPLLLGRKHMCSTSH